MFLCFVLFYGEKLKKMLLVVWFCVVICSCVADNVTETTSAAPTPNLSQEKRTTNSTAPLEFPKYNQNYTFVENSSIRENLASHTDTEISDLLGKDELKEASTTPTLLVNFPPNPSEENEDLGRKNETEWIENGSDTEDNKFVSTVINKELLNKTNSSHNDDITLLDGHVAAIVAMTFLVIAIFAYIGLLKWRRFLETKYGSREMLVDEDDFIDPNDMKHFSI